MWKKTRRREEARGHSLRHAPRWSGELLFHDLRYLFFVLVDARITDPEGIFVRRAGLVKLRHGLLCLAEDV